MDVQPRSVWEASCPVLVCQPANATRLYFAGCPLSTSVSNGAIVCVCVWRVTFLSSMSPWSAVWRCAACWEGSLARPNSQRLCVASMSSLSPTSWANKAKFFQLLLLQFHFWQDPQLPESTGRLRFLYAGAVIVGIKRLSRRMPRAAMFIERQQWALWFLGRSVHEVYELLCC